MHFHPTVECQPPKHPACIQLLDTPPQIELQPEMSERFQPEELRSLAINVDMLLANREQYNCMAKFKELILRMLDEAKGLRQGMEEELQNLEPPKPQDSKNS